MRNKRFNIALAVATLLAGQAVSVKAENIVFADPQVEALCLTWDGDNDGSLSMEEAAAVTDLGKVFSKKKNISHFDELQYFTGIASIPDMAFFNCTALVSITIPANVTAIGQNALSGCTALETIGVATGNNAFCSVDGVLFNKEQTVLVQFPLAKADQYAVPEGTVTIGRDAFFSSVLTAITLPSTLKTLDFDAFGYSKFLTEINLPEGLETISDYAFDHCTGLSTIIIPASVSTIGSKAFNYCNTLTLVNCERTGSPAALQGNAFPASVYEDGVLLVPEGAGQLYAEAEGWGNFTRIAEERPGNISFADANVKAICVANWDNDHDGNLSYREAAFVLSLGEAFTGNTAIKSFKELQYFTALTKIDDNAFNACSNLTSIIIPDNVRKIGKSAFYACHKLKEIVLPEGLEVIDEKGISACIALTEINLPSTLTTINTRAFYYNKVLPAINLPASLTKIGAYAFSSCGKLMTVTANMENPCAITSNVFPQNTYSNGALYVPSSAFDNYVSADCWKDFMQIWMLGGAYLTSEHLSFIAGFSEEDLIISLHNNSHPIVAFQFCLKPYSIGINTDITLIPSDNFVLYNAQNNNGYRVYTFYSPQNDVLPVNVGDLLAIKCNSKSVGAPPYNSENWWLKIYDFKMVVEAGDGSYRTVNVDDYTAHFTIVDPDTLDVDKGDINFDGSVNINDVVVLLRYMYTKQPYSLRTEMVDINEDGVVDIIDIPYLVDLCLNYSPSNSAPAHSPAANIETMTWETGDGLSLSIENAASYVAAQMDIITEGDLNINGISTVSGHSAAWRQIGEGRYRVLLFSNNNHTFTASEPLLFLDMEGDGSISIDNVTLVDEEGEGHTATASTIGYATGIETVSTMTDAAADVYSVSGQLVRRNATSLKGLPAGLYIMNGKKVQVR